MINRALLDKKVQKYITENLNSDISVLRMKKSPFPEVSSLELVQQIQGKKIARTKFPFLSDNDQIIYPPHLNLEQASSEATAKFKQTLISGRKGIDLTGGTGIDSYFISEQAEKFCYVEPNTDLFDTTTHNFQILNRNNTLFFNQTAEKFLLDNTDTFDFIYLDPSRRDENKTKKFLLEDLVPNIIQLQERLMQISPAVYIKLSPLFDLQQATQQLALTEIYIVSLKNEAKELIMKLGRDSANSTDNPLIRCINLESSQPDFSFCRNEEKQMKSPVFSLPETYLFIPNASILKSGAFKLVAHKFNLKKLHSNTHIYTSTTFIHEFPGRIFSVLEPDFNPQKSKQKKFNIISRNYPLKIEEIKKKYKLTEGGEEYLFFIRAENRTICILAEPAQSNT